MHRKLLEIVSVEFETTGKLLMIYSSFAKYLRKNGKKMKWFISYLQALIKLMIN